MSHAHRISFRALALAMGAALAGVARGADWPQFRGPNASGVATGGFPAVFGPDTNVVWKTAVPGGNSSPVLWGPRVFLTAFADNQLLTVALSRTDGREVWRRALPAGPIEHGARLGNPATATPATDGDRVVVYFGPFGLASYAPDGTEQWRLPLPNPVTQHGAGTSPVIAGDWVLLNCDQDVGSHLLAVDKRTGLEVWRALRPAARRGFSTPLPWPSTNPEIAVIAGTLRLTAYRLKDGVEAWHVDGLPNEMVSSPVGGDDGNIYVAGWVAGSGVSRMPTWDSLVTEGDADHDGMLTQAEAPPGPARQHFQYLDSDKDGRLTREEYEAAAHAFDASHNVAMAVRPGGSGDVTATHVVWKQTRGLPYCATPLAYDGRLYLVRNGGLATCLDAKTGKPFYQEERLGAIGDNYASPVASDGRVCVFSQAGVGVVYQAGDALEVIARNALGELVVATPAIADGRLYVRTASAMYAFGK